MRTLEQARALKPEDWSILATLAAIYAEEREYELAAETYAKAAALDPSVKMARNGLGWSLNHLGRFEEMARVFSAIIRDEPEDVAALSALSQIPVGFVDIDILGGLNRVRQKPGQSRDELEISLGFARAGAFDKAKKYAEAWRELVTVNGRVFAMLKEELGKDVRNRAKFLDLLKTAKPHPQTQPPKAAPCLSLFILGPSRSGKTTMELLAAQLPGVKRGYENPMVENATRRSFQEAGLITRRRLAELPPPLDELFRQHYFCELEERARGARVFTNTHPGRINDAWRLAIAIPDIRFVFIKRDPYDLALRIYMKNYHSGHAYSYNLRETLRYIDWYHSMMDGIAAQFPNLARIIAYEDMIADPRRALAEVAELCGLSVPDGVVVPEIGDDRGAATPYRTFMDAALSGS
jgi:tetratricopeptide (TPR) repeat protein